MAIGLEAAQPAARPRESLDAERCQRVLGQTLGVVDVHRLGAAAPRWIAPAAGHGQRQPARLRGVGVPARRPLVRPADLEDAHVALLAPRVGRHHAEHSLEGMHAQVRGVLAQRVQHLHRLGRRAERSGARGIAEARGHGLQQPGADERPAHEAFLPQAVGRQLVVAPDADDLLGEVVLHRQIAPEARDLDVENAAAVAHGEAEASEDLARLRARRRDAQHALDAGQAQPHAHRLATASIDVEQPARDDAAGQLGHELGGAIVGGHQPLDVGAALEAIGRVGPQPERARGPPDRGRIEVGALEEHAGGALADLRVLAAHHTGQADGALGIGDDQHRAVERAGLAVEGREPLAGRRPADDDRLPGHAVGVEGVQRMAELPQHVVGDVHDVADGPQPAGPQARRHPRRRRSDAQAADHPHGVARAQVGGLDAHAGERAGRLA